MGLAFHAEELDVYNCPEDYAAFDSSIAAAAPPPLYDESSDDDSSANSGSLLPLFTRDEVDTMRIDDTLCDNSDSLLSFANANVDNYSIANSTSSSVHHIQDNFSIVSESIELSIPLLRSHL